MNIKITSEKTGLTKRAIKYYESQGLIISSRHYGNNYREYSGEDIIKLNLIGALRVLDIPIVEIKKVIDGKKEFISSILRRIFPGKYGEAFILSYEPFLNITIDNDEKEKIWIKLVELLDDFDDLSETEEGSSLISKYNKLDEDTYTEEFKKKRIDSTYKIINWNEEYIEGNIKRAVEKMETVTE